MLWKPFQIAVMILFGIVAISVQDQVDWMATIIDCWLAAFAATLLLGWLIDKAASVAVTFGGRSGRKFAALLKQPQQSSDPYRRRIA